MLIEGILIMSVHYYIFYLWDTTIRQLLMRILNFSNGADSERSSQPSSAKHDLVLS